MFWVSRYPGGKDQSAWEDALQSQAVSIEKPEAEGRARECGISQAKWLEVNHQKLGLMNMMYIICIFTYHIISYHKKTRIE